MNFDEWLRSCGLSDASVAKYYGAIAGPLTDWAIHCGALSRGSIFDVLNGSVFQLISSAIQQTPIFIERNNAGHHMYSAALRRYAEYLNEKDNNWIERDLEALIKTTNIDLTQKMQMINARIGQGRFRQALIEYWGKCAVTGYADHSVLIASHIKPWSHSTDSEKLHFFNGLLLLPNLDKAFDRGLISFTECGSILLSPQLRDMSMMGIAPDMRVTLSKGHQHYMAWHREYVFLKA